jgi:putative protease
MATRKRSTGRRRAGRKPARKKTARRKKTTARKKAARSKATRKKPARKRSAGAKARKPAARRKPARKQAGRKAAPRASTRKPARAKPRPAAGSAPPAPARPAAPATKAAIGERPLSLAAAKPTRIGSVTHYFAHVNAAIVAVQTGDVRVGDTLHFRGHTTDFYQRIDRIELDHRSVPLATAGQEVGVQVSQRVREGDEVIRVSR